MDLEALGKVLRVKFLFYDTYYSATTRLTQVDYECPGICNK